jgi:hypothetical protein
MKHLCLAIYLEAFHSHVMSLSPLTMSASRCIKGYDEHARRLTVGLLLKDAPLAAMLRRCGA